jgi:hypothetical protein
MPFMTVGAAMTDVDAGTYPATLVAINEKRVPSKFSTSPDGMDDSYEWVFALDNGEEVNGLSSKAITPKSRAFGYLVALLGKDRVQRGVGFELDDLIGKRALVSISINDGGWPRIDGVLPPLAPERAKPQPLAVATPVAPAQPDEDGLPF